MISSVMKDKKDGKFSEKTSTLVVKIIKGDKSRSVGQVVINLANYLESETPQRVKMTLEKCPDKNATLEFDIKSTLINVTSGSESMSMMSGAVGADAMSTGSGPKSEFKFTDIDKKERRAPSASDEQQELPNDVGVINPKQIKFIKKRQPGQQREHAAGIPRAPNIYSNYGSGLNADDIIKGTQQSSNPESTIDDSKSTTTKDSAKLSVSEQLQTKKTLKIDKTKINFIKKKPSADEKDNQARQELEI